jgi:hypothetical protein
MIKATKKTLYSARATPTKVWKKTYSYFVIAKIDAFQIHYAPKKIHLFKQPNKPQPGNFLFAQNMLYLLR